MNILIVEDEARIAKRIQRMTQEILGASLSNLWYAGTIQESQKFIEKNEIDLLLLDLNLNGESGFDLLQSVVSESFHTIIISAYKDQAITAFEYGVLDFVPKPFNRDRLEQAFNRVILKETVETTQVKHLAIKKRGKIHLILLDDIVYCKGAGPYSELMLKDGSKELHDKSLEKLSQLLSQSFERIHKSYLVKMTEIKEILVKSGSKYEAELKNGEFLPIGRTKYKELKAKWV